MVGLAVAGIVGVIVGSVIAAMVVRRSVERSTRAALTTSLGRLTSVDTDEAPTVEDLLVHIDRSGRQLVDDRDAAAAENSRLRASFDGVSAAVLLFDRDGEMVDSNAAAEPFVRARHGDALVGAAIGELVTDALVDGRATTVVELFGPPRRAMEVTAVRLPEPVGGVVAAVEDVTHRRHLEEVRTDLVANISHELKTPVGAIGLLAETIQGETDAAVVERLAGRIAVEAVRLSSIVDDLLDLSRIEASTQPDGAVVLLTEVVEEATDRLRPAADRAGVDLVVRVPDPSVDVVGDRWQLVSAVANLVDNAIKYSDRGSSVEVAVSVDGDDAVLAVSDHGMGIPTRDVDRIFERFYRVDQARSRDTGGSGLGLSIVRHVALNHGGRVEVQSRLGEGSTFLLTVPRASDGPSIGTDR